jgi:prepilin-type N-terminal cleavage/methylation domain-containing protein
MLNGAGFSRHRQRGLSLVELMVGITIGLIVVAAAALLVSGQLSESRRLIAEAQIQQDLRASADVIARELRRSGGIGEYDNLHNVVWKLDNPADPWASVNLENFSVNSTGTEVTYKYTENALVPTTPLGFKLASGVIQARLYAGGWQDLTDPSSMEVTVLSFTRLPDTVARIPCPKPCPPPGGGTSCWPSVNQRAIEVRITARHRAFPQVERTHVSRVRLRNDRFVFYNEVNPVAGEVCPP